MSPVSIPGVTVNPRTRLAGLDASRITFCAGYVQVNLAGLASASTTVLCWT